MVQEIYRDLGGLLSSKLQSQKRKKVREMQRIDVGVTASLGPYGGIAVGNGRL